MVGGEDKSEGLMPGQDNSEDATASKIKDILGEVDILHAFSRGQGEGSIRGQEKELMEKLGRLAQTDEECPRLQGGLNSLNTHSSTQGWKFLS